MIAFVTVDGLVLAGFGPGQPVDRYLGRGGRLDFIVGVDAITTPEALRTLAELQANWPQQVVVRAFYSAQGLFHPKLLVASKADGSGTVLVGSSNLTRGGLSGNTELMALIDIDAATLSAWTKAMDDQFADHPWLRPLDEEAMQLALRQSAVTRRMHRPEVAAEAERSAGQEVPVRVMIRVVPAGERSGTQVGIPAQFMREYFRFGVGGTRKVTLHEVVPGGTIGRAELRPLVASPHNLNQRIEVRGLKGIPNTSDAHPLVIFQELEFRRFRYLVLPPAGRGYSAIMRHLRQRAPRPARALPTEIMTLQELLRVWPAYPV